ncbi:MAG TPA: DNA translocase FtsK 4TM domain-containing protein [Candidatus Binatia bacterium]|nr:DNA translocase FtsK 4TM domain-containing protein [Candidatus Binatia bacterium]
MAARRPADSPARHLVREVEAISAGAVAVFLALSLFSYSADGRANLGGPVGHAIAGTALHALGVAAYLFPLYLVYFTVALLRGEAGFGGTRLAGAGLLVASVAALGGLVTNGRAIVRGGGWLGGFVGTAAHELLGLAGAYLALAVVLVVALVLATGVSAVATARDAAAGLAGAARAAGARAAALLRWTPAPRPAPPRGRKTTAPVLLDEAVEEPAEPPASAPPIIREPEPKPDPIPPKRPRRLEMQEELFAQDSYRLPALALLDAPVRTAQPLDESALLASSRILETKLADFGVVGKVVAVRPGPVITTFEFEPAPGVKVNRIVTLADDLSMALRALSVRVLAPIPGKPVVGIEVSNPRRDKVFIRELLSSDEYQRSESKLTLALGKDTTGNVTVADLARMPHLLVAGATGTGKSVSMNAMIMSILFKSSPRDVRFIMIDPKMLELSTYEHIPHLLVPVVTDPKKAAAALANTMREMETRYRLLHEKGVRNIDSYNRLIRDAAAARGAEPSPAEGEGDAPPPPAAGGPSDVLLHRHLPRIVIIVDELADLMMTVGREIEESITRLAQKARAAGIHLILATQRPSVDVITGLIKANFPARISFQVTSRVDSRTILDAIGAERLLGEGDMLFLPPGTARVQRLHGSFVSDQDVHRVVDFIKRQEEPRYEMELLESDDEEDGEGEDGEDLSDEMYDMAVRLVTEHRQASISWLQRRLRVGYNRAARMIERMEREGVVSPASGARPREVIARRIDE